MILEIRTVAADGRTRVSTDERNLGRRIDALTAHGVCPERLHQETASGAAPNRPVLGRLMSDVLTEGDTLVVTELDRLSRRTSRLILTLDELTTRGITVESLHERVDTSTADGMFSVTLLGALAQRERDRIRECTMAGLEAARNRGHRPGRPIAVKPEQYETVLLRGGQGRAYRAIASATGLSASTVARICRGDTPGHETYRRQQEIQPVLR